MLWIRKFPIRIIKVVYVKDGAQNNLVSVGWPVGAILRQSPQFLTVAPEWLILLFELYMELWVSHLSLPIGFWLVHACCSRQVRPCQHVALSTLNRIVSATMNNRSTESAFPYVPNQINIGHFSPVICILGYIPGWKIAPYNPVLAGAHPFRRIFQSR